MKNKNIKTEINSIFISSILIYCGYEMDRNINYKTILNNSIVFKHLENGIDKKILKFIDKNYDFTGKVIYLRNNADSECMIWYNKTDCWLVFIGTQIRWNDKMSLCKDMITNICLGLESIDFINSKVKIHSKYISNMKCDNLLGKIEKIIDKLGFDKINICAHSMGCGLGLYAGISLTDKFKNKHFNLITLGAPKIGNKYLNKYIKHISNLTHIDFINGKDIIPLFPFIYPNYLHISSKTLIADKDGDIDTCKKPNELNIFTNYSINDHITTNTLINVYKYIKKLK